MSATVKLAGFAAGLLLVFGVATVAGGAIGPDREGSDAAAGDDAMAAHGGDEACCPTRCVGWRSPRAACGSSSTRPSSSAVARRS